MKLRVIITGTTGMVGEGVLQTCIASPDVEKILLISRRSGGYVHPKVEEVLHSNFQDITSIADAVKGYDACYFCAGVSSVGMKEEAYYAATYTLTLGFAQTLAEQNPGMTFCYVSGAGTDSTEKGRSMWARVKGKTENDLMKLPFKAVYNFRPALMKSFKGAKYVPRFYQVIDPFYGVFKLFGSAYFLTLEQVGKAMMAVSIRGYTKKVLEAGDIARAAESASA